MRVSAAPKASDIGAIAVPGCPGRIGQRQIQNRPAIASAATMTPSANQKRPAKRPASHAEAESAAPRQRDWNHAEKQAERDPHADGDE